MRRQKGFTITELMFAMTGLAVLLIVLLGSIIQLTRTYNKGITLKRVNQSGRAIGEELQRAIQSSSASNINVFHEGSQSMDRVCIGDTSFVWQSQNPTPLAASANRYDDVGTGPPITGLVKVHKNICSPSAIPRDLSTQLLDGDLIIRDLGLETSGKMVAVTYTISTLDDSSDSMFTIDGDGNTVCRGGASDDFCALNRFNVTIYARGSGGI